MDPSMRPLLSSFLFVSALLAQNAERFPGYRVVDGDMLLRPDSAITSQIPARLWTNNTVPYIIDTDIPNPTRIMDAITWYNQNTPVTYQARTGEVNFVHYVRSIIGNGVCYSSVGMIGGEQFIHVEDACTTSTLIHEMTHTTGFYHEQERQDRNLNITVLYENIDKAQFSEFPVPSAQTEQDKGGYEYASRMHYGAFSFSVNNLPVMETVPAGITLDPYMVLSPGDLDTLFRMYGKPPTKTTVVTNPPGLLMIVDGATVSSPQVYDWAPGSTHTLAVDTQTIATGRYTFGKWSDGGTGSHTITSDAGTTIYTANFVQSVQVGTGAVPAAGGRVSINSISPDGYFARQTTLVLTATPNAGYAFLNWSGGNGLTCPFGDSQNPLTLTTAAININCTANFTQSPITTIATNPPGLPVTVDGRTYTYAPINLAWTPGSTHNISTAAPASTSVSPTRYIFQGWSDGKATSHSVTAGTSAATITANYRTQYLLVQVPAVPATQGTFTITPPSTDGFYDAGTVLQVKAVPASGMSFVGWTRDMFGQPNPGTLTMNSQMDVTANFAAQLPNLSVVNGANFMRSPVSPGELVTIFGANIGPPQFAGAVLTKDGKFPTTLAGTMVMFNGMLAPIVYASANQTAVLVPYGLAGAATTGVSVIYNGSRTVGPTYNVDVSAPGIFTVKASGVGPAVVTNQDGTINSADHPAAKGSVIVLYATGEGQLAPGGVDGALTGTPLPLLTQPVGLRIGGKPAVLNYAGEAPGEVSGVMQVNAVVPIDAPSGLTSLYLVIGENISPMGVTMWVR